jgi:hypothetical protein
MSGGAFSGVIQTCLDVEDVPTFGGYGKLMIALMWTNNIPLRMRAHVSCANALLMRLLPSRLYTKTWGGGPTQNFPEELRWAASLQ